MLMDMNDSAAIGSAMSVFFVALTVLCIYIQRQQRKKKISILDFQKGLKYRQGKFVELLEPGTYGIGSNENVVVMDMRPNAIAFERMPVTTCDGVTLGVSITAKVQVTDPRLAVSTSKNSVQDAAVVLRDALKVWINSISESELRKNRAELENKILAEVGQKVPGLKYLSLMITELTVPTQPERSVGFAASKQ
jgi:regulator of protease activity HflC (stomatin/prohibitin superfamily)